MSRRVPQPDAGPSPSDPPQIRAYLRGGPFSGRVVDAPADAGWLDVPVRGLEYPARYARTGDSVLGAEIFVYDAATSLRKR